MTGHALLTAPQMAGIVGDESPLTGDDIRLAISHTYNAFSASLIVRLGQGDGPFAKDHYRSSHSGSAGTQPDDTHLRTDTDVKGIWVRRHTTEWARAGHITWTTAERALRSYTTPATARTLTDAVHAWTTFLHLPDSEKSTGKDWALRRAMDAAWHAIIRGTPPAEPVQLDLFGEAS